MAKQLNVSLNIQANTEQAKREIQALQYQLNKLGTGLSYDKGFGKEFTSNISKAKTEIAELQAKLQMATNVDTGKLDFTKLSASLKASNKTLGDQSRTLVSLGPEGEKAFLQLSKAIAQSEIPIIRISDKLKSLQTTLSNTLRWQISSSVLHGFMGALQTAYGYSQDLNRSLNDIRIVTGYSADKMADFAERANKAAQALSTTTTAYTDAALIFYQQGLSDEQVEARTNATIKMANVTGENAEHVSSYMTAIWNNFDNGSKSLEYYADVMTELGARTAASSEEIAEGMEKFAAVGNTVGLSYEYAAAAVTTVVDKTRQSADIVGTSFKSLFARLEGLQLGETLDDGTTLNKYAQALAAVGVNIKDQNGELKAMDQILDEMGAKWNTLSNEQQVALAQTVGGVRQYTQLIALMENYDAFQQNIQYARESEGTLQRQQNIYAESWEASTDRVRAAWEALYQDIIKDNFFIELNNGLADFLGGIDKLLDSLGGVKGLLLAISPLVVNIFGDSLRKLMSDMVYTLSMMNPANVKAMQDQRDKEIASSKRAALNYFDAKGDTLGKEKWLAEVDYEERRQQGEKLLTEEQKNQLKYSQDLLMLDFDRAKEMDEQIAKAEKLNQEKEKELKIASETALKESSPVELNKDIIGNYSNQIGQYGQATGLRSLVDDYVEGGNPKLNPGGDQDYLNLIRGYVANNIGSLPAEIVSTFEAAATEYQKAIDEKDDAQISEASAKFTQTLRQSVVDFGDQIKKNISSDANIQATIKEQQDAGRKENQENVFGGLQRLGVKIDKRYTPEHMLDKAEEEVQKKLAKANRENDSAGLSRYSKLLKNITQIKDKYKETEDSLNNMALDMEKIDEAMEQATDAGAEKAKAEADKALGEQTKRKLQEDREEQEKIQEEMMARAQVQDTLNGAFAGGVQAVTSLASAYVQLNSLMNIWGQVAEGNVSIGQALSQTLLTSTTLITTLKSAYEGISSIIKLNTLLQKEEDRERLASILNSVVKTDVVTAESLAEDGLAVSIGKVVKAFMAEKVATVALNPATIALAVAIGLLVASYMQLKKVQEDVAESSEKVKKKLEETKAWREENKAILEQCDAYDQVKTRQDLNLATREDLNASILETAEALGIENAQILANADAQDLLQAEVEKKEADLKEERDKNLETERTGSRENLRLASLAQQGTFSQIESALYSGTLQTALMGYAGLAFVDPAKASARLKGTHISAGFGGSVGNAGEQALLDDLEALGLSGMSFTGSGFTFDQSAMSDAEYSQLLDFIADAMGDNFNKYGGAANDMLTQLSGMVDDWGAYAEEYKQVLSEQAQIYADSIVEEASISGGATAASIRGGGITDYIDVINASAANAYRTGVFEDMGATEEEVRKYFADSYSDYFSEEVAQQFAVLSAAADLMNTSVDSISNRLKRFSSEEQDAIIEGLARTPQLTYAILDSNIESQAELIQSITDKIDFTNLISNLENLQKALLDLSFGAVYTTEDMQKFVDSIMGEGHSIEEFMNLYGEDRFTALANGQYEFIGNEQEFYNQIYEDTISQIESGQGALLDALSPEIAELGGRGAIEDKISELTDQSEQLVLNADNANITSSILAAAGVSSAEELNGLIASYQSLLDKQDEMLASATGLQDQLVTQYTTYEQLQELEAKGLVSAGKAQQSFAAAVANSAKQLGISNEELATQINYLEEYNVYLQDNRTAAAQVALAQERVNAALSDLSSNMESYVEALGTKDTVEYGKAISSLANDLQNLFNTDETISEDFILQHLEDIQAAAEGDVQAARELEQAYALSNIDTTGLDSLGQSLDEINQRLDEVAWDDIEVGMSLDSDPFLEELYDSMNKAVAAGEMSADQMQEFWNALGFELEPDYTTLTLAEWASATGGSLQGMPMEVAQNQTVRVIKSFKSSHYTGAASSSTLSQATSGSGKSSGGGKSSKKEEKDAKDEFERYYKITRQIKDQEDAVNRLSKAKDRAYGKAKLEYLDQETEALEKQLDLQEEYIKEIEDYYRSDKSNLKAFGATFDSNGVLTNYESLIQQELDKQNEAVEAYNENQDEAAMESAEKRYQYFQETLKQYDETNQLYQSELDNLRELQNTLYDKQLETIQTKVEMDVEVNAMELNQLEYQLDRIEKKAFSTAEAIANIAKSMANVQRDIDSYQQATLDILSNHGIGSISELNGLSDDQIAGLGFTQDEIKALMEYNDNLLSDLEKVNDYEEQILNGPLELFKEWNSEFDYFEDRLSHYSSLLKTYKDIAQLIYSNASGLDQSFMMGVMNNAYLNMVNEVEGAYSELEANRAALAQARSLYEDALANGENDQNLKILQDNLREMEKAVETSEDNMLSKTQEALKQAEEMLKQTVANAKESFLDLVSASDWDMTQFDRLKTLDDQYLDDYEQIYEFSKLTRDVNKSLQTIDTVRGHERLKEILEEMADIQERGAETSQYEVDALRKKYELRLAEIALEDQQNAKSMVRMQRDNEGNWSYVYTADNDAVDDARQKYEDKLYEYQKLNSDFIKEQQQNFLKLEKEYADQMEKIATDASLTQDQKEERLQETQAYYQRMADIMTDQLGIAIDRNSELYTKDWTDYAAMTGYKISEEGKYQTALKYTYFEVLMPGLEQASDLFDMFTEATVGEGGYLPRIEQGLDDFKVRQDEVLNAAGTSLETYRDDVVGAMEDISDASTTAIDQIGESAEKMEDTFSEVVDKVRELDDYDLSEFRGGIEDLVESVSKLVDKFKDLSDSASQAYHDIDSSAGNIPGFPSTPGEGGDGSGSGGGKGGGYSDRISIESATEEQISDLWKELSEQEDANKGINLASTIAGAWASANHNAGLRVGSSVTLTGGYTEFIRNWLLGHKQEVGDLLRQQTKNFSFDTGGYTGAWGAEGRLAFLHQKELVLNADDTKNMLNIVQLVRDIVDTRAASTALPNIANSFYQPVGGANNLEQNVHIEASFPNATDHNEIELALTNLVNRASQYANRK